MSKLFEAVARGDLDEVKRLVAKGADVNSVDQWGNTPLHWAAIYGHAVVVDHLVAHGADVKAVNLWGTTALHRAAAMGDAAIVEHLVAHSADVNDVNAVGQLGNTPLHCAALFGRDEIVRLLVAKGADVNAVNQDGDTPLQLAAKNGNEAIARFLGNQQKEPPTFQIKELISLDYARRIMPDKSVIAGNYIALAYMTQLVCTVFDEHLVANGVNAVLAEIMEGGLCGVGLYLSLKGIEAILTKADRPIPREIIDQVRATADHAVARKDGKLGIWLVHQPSQDAPVAMTESEFKAYEKQLADGNEALTKIAVGFTGKVTVTRTLGGKLHADGMPALVVINPKNGAREEKWFSHGAKNPTPDARQTFDEQNAQGLRV